MSDSKRSGYPTIDLRIVGYTNSLGQDRNLIISDVPPQQIGQPINGLLICADGDEEWDKETNPLGLVRVTDVFGGTRGEKGKWHFRSPQVEV
jgi:hypothetical protein